MGELFDFDGTITGHAGWMVARDQPFYTSAWLVYFIQIYIFFYHFIIFCSTTFTRCEDKPHWGNMSACPHRYVNMAGTATGYSKIDMTITRNDVIEFPENTLSGDNTYFKDPWHPKLSTDHSYIYSFPNSSQIPNGR